MWFLDLEVGLAANDAAAAAAAAHARRVVWRSRQKTGNTTYAMD